MEIYSLLEEDHQKVSMLFEQLKLAPERAFEKREQLFLKLKAELEAHSEAEEAVFYTRLMKKETMEKTLAESYAEHHTIAELLNELTSMAVNNDEWMVKCNTLQALVTRHVSKEENVIFEKARRIFTVVEGEKMAQQFLDAKDYNTRLSA